MNAFTFLGLMNTPFHDDQIGPAVPGEVGTVSGWCRAGLSGIALLLLRLPQGGKRYVAGDTRCIRDLAEALVGQEVVVAEEPELQGRWFVSPVEKNCE